MQIKGKAGTKRKPQLTKRIGIFMVTFCRSVTISVTRTPLSRVLTTASLSVDWWECCLP